MNTPRRLFALAWALVAAAALSACVSEPTWLAPGASKAEALQRLGSRTAVYALPGGAERLQYSRAPAGFEVNNVDLDASGHVVSVRQELNEALFARTIQPGVWREADILRTYGRPYDIAPVSSFDGMVWSWRYKAINARRLLYIYVDRQGLVQYYNVGDDLSLEILVR